MASPVIEYTNLLHAKKSLTDPAVMQFKQAHQQDQEFLQQAEVVEWAFQARNTVEKPVQGVNEKRNVRVPA